jgi:hypothetical protein
MSCATEPVYESKHEQCDMVTAGCRVCSNKNKQAVIQFLDAKHDQPAKIHGIMSAMYGNVHTEGNSCVVVMEVLFRISENEQRMARLMSLQYPQMLQTWRMLFVQTDIGVFMYWHCSSKQGIVQYTQLYNTWDMARCVPLDP